VIPAASARAPARPVGGAATMLLALGGTALLMSRLALTGHPMAGLLLTTTYAILGLVFLVAPVRPSADRQLAVPLALGVGLAGVAAASAVSGPPIPIAHGPDALWLGALAAASEEIFFRRFLYARLVTFGPVVAIAVSALLFAAVHVPAYGPAVFWVDLGAGLLLSWQRWASGTWTVPAATHVLANFVAVLR